MLNVLDGVINTNRFDVDVTDGVITSGIEGLWVAPTDVAGSTKYDFAADADVAFQIWTESDKTGVAGLTKDAVYLKKVAVLSGSYRVETDQFDGSPSVGDDMKTTAAGKLEVASADDNAVATVLKAPANKTYLGRTISIIEVQIVSREAN